ncbi:hypothetical protein [Promicromonospora sp. NPDC050880]|uniref:hypothetical protein n=1 Tax=Promicromonospora sp. NPDC050880 TaxID=3364406 RepID=UPI0037952E75
MTWEMMDGIDGWRWAAAAAVWLVTLALSVVVGSWVVPWVLRRASRGDLPWARYEPPVVPQALEPGTAGEPGEGEEAEGTAGAEGDTGKDEASAAEEAAPTGTMHPDAVAILRGGAWLGVLERLAITGSILAGYPYGIAIVVAIKGLGRYAELRDQPVASERFVVGTLASLIWSVATGLLGLAAINTFVI